MRILSVANCSSYGNANTALHRHHALCQNFPQSVDLLDSAFKFGLINKIINRLFKYHVNFPFYGISDLNDELVKKASSEHYDMIWIDKGISIQKKTLLKIKKNCPHILIVGYSPDEMTQRHNQSTDFLKSLPLYDAYITTKSYAVSDLEKLGAKNVYFVNNAFEKTFHYPRQLTDEDIVTFGGEIGFIGAWEAERANSILFLVEKGLNVRVWGGGKWLQYKDKYQNLKIEDSALFSEDYAKAIDAFKINLCFLRKMNFDQQTTRSVEIPACGGFMLAERTAEHQNLFEEGKEAAFFSNDEELYQQCLYYLNHEQERQQICDAGYKRCINSGYDNQHTIKRVLNEILLDLGAENEK